MIRVDFHVHSIYSPDSIITFEMLVEYCRRNSVDAVAIMDHDVIEGALEFSRAAGEMLRAGEWAPRVLVGEEIRSSKGEICGLFLNRWIRPGLSPEATMDRIRAQGGLVYVPHPFDLLKFKRLNSSELVDLADRIDILEAFNGKPRFPAANLLARHFLQKHPFPVAAGSDSHEPTRIGAAGVEIEDFDGPSDLLEKLSRARITGRRYSPVSSAITRFRMQNQPGRKAANPSRKQL